MLNVLSPILLDSFKTLTGLNEERKRAGYIPDTIPVISVMPKTTKNKGRLPFKFINSFVLAKSERVGKKR